ncbi:DUF5960 family protein [Enterococcus xiangfangensis]|uniref:DUF5960 family protein n=1 Tax=Enterococcus xiangfangensis TaxID=1296537 RepID=UPI0010F6CABD|nr:DUF5960 family protein [Enterococcus xiangfangensis]MBM7712012.1 hypothetical protein [Enterococcus xiangfangensis]NBK08024.1 hypothetical protein [Enterococcus asini]
MDKTYFEGQTAFLEDYQKVAKTAMTDQQVIDEVMEQLNKPIPDDQLVYILPSDQTVNGQAVRFPFRKELIAQDNEATVSTQFFYEGSPYEYAVVEDEQP